ncbi:MAG: PAS domain S-box protein [Bacteroidota bacterium]|nr:PAS domain S-box protein [Bacteroidota bacterium]
MTDQKKAKEELINELQELQQAPNSLAERLTQKMLNKKSHFVILGLIISVLLILGGYFYYSHSYRQLRTEKENDLKAIAELKIDQLVQWNKERTANAKVISLSPLFSNGVEKWLLDKRNKKNELNIKERLSLAQKEYGYESIILASTKGDILLSIGLKSEIFDDITTEKIIESARKDQITFTDFYSCNKHNKIHYDIIAPIKNERNIIIANLLFRIEPSKYLYPLIQKWPTPSKTAETLLFKKDGDSVLYLNELRHQENTALKLRFPLTRKDLPAVQAVLGKTGFFYGKDYRGADVLAYLSPVPGTDWYMSSKIDSSEILSELKFRGIAVALFVMMLLIALSIGIAWIYQYSQKNIYQNLWQVQEEFQATLYSIGDAVISTDKKEKIKYLNPVAEQLTGWKMAEAIGEKLEKVFRIINEETRNTGENPVERVLREGVIVGLANHTLLIAKDGTERPIADSGAPIKDEEGEIIGVVLVFRDQTEERLQQNLLNARLSLFEFAASHTLNEILTKTLDEVEVLTNSKIGFYHFILPDQETLHLQAWSTRTEKEYCKAVGKGLHYKLSEAGVWTDCVHQKKPVIHNDYASLPHKKGMPEGHSLLTRELVVPIIRNDQIVAVLGVGNKPGDYTDKDVEAVAFIADVAWEIAQKKIKEEEIYRLTQLYAMLSQTNQAIVRMKGKEELFREVCRVAKNFGEFQLAWIGQYNSEKNQVEPFAWEGEENGFIQNELNDAPEEMRNLMPCFRAYNENRIVVANDVAVDPNCDYYREAALKRNFKSLAATPIHLLNHVIGVFVLYSSEANFFGEKEVKLLEEVGIDISFALDTYDKEGKRLIADELLMKSERQLIESEEKFRNLFENHSAVKLLIDPENQNIVEANKAAALFYGWPVEELERMKISQLNVLSPDEIRREMEKALNRQRISFEFKHRKANGSIIDVEIYTSPINIGEKVYLHSIIHDITEKKLTEKELQKRSLAVEQSPVSVVITNLTGNIEYVNTKFCTITGYLKEDVIGKNPRILKSGHQDDRIYKELWNTILSGKKWKGELQNKKKNGEVYWESALISPLFNEDRAITHFLAVKEDITERKNMLSELITAKDHAQESDRLKSAFLANMSHEIRTPMNGILGFSELLKEPGLSNEQQQEYIRIIEKSGARMLNIINDIVDISKIESGLMKLDLKQSDINEQIQYIYTFLKPEAEAKGIQLSYKNFLPAKEAIIKTDREKVYAILTNLVKNAIKYTDKGSIEFGYDRVETLHATSLRFYVKDTGIGIPQNRQEAIFERFIQADVVDNQARQGAGLGLAITKSYVEMLGGRIWIESEQGIGSTFYFTLPYLPEAEEKIIVENMVSAGVEENHVNKLKILIVEDDESSRKFISIGIQEFGKEIINVQTGTEAVETCRIHPDIELILMDIQLPEIDGYEATRQIRKFNSKAIIIAQTAYALEGDREKAVEAGCNDYMSKPIKRDQLTTLIKKYFNKTKV